ncbi:copper homeostasis periplasmic binding protein CopC [Sphingobium sp. TKS]|uniref:copper homeostasis periplasmic binding protein CopC n=1 Tax=Sphingobium sp. TKS TaxID=1315974 RepID=UPI0007705E25|nr:copper homeostasis periplasmic binding protein CopC [Sphingobium sp. TKS]AMK21603.1 copper resistance protein CopC [Sphingobium sp. TKS]
MIPIRTIATSLAAIAVAAATPALAHPRLLRAVPTQSGTASNVREVRLTFSETLIAPLSGFDVVMTGMPTPSPSGKHIAMKVSGIRASLAPDRKTLRASLARPLPAGRYDVNWHAVSTDTHRISGKISFTVR